MTEKCETCKFWRSPDEPVWTGQLQSLRVIEGFCVRYAPKGAYFPDTKANDWCGEYEACL